jgi:WD40 repeat protein
VEAKDLRTGAVLFSETSETGLASWYFAADPVRHIVLVTRVETGESFLVDPATWQRRPSPLVPGEASLAAYSRDGTRLVTIATDGTISLRDPATFAEVRRLNAQAGTPNSASWQQLALSDDGRYLVTSHDNRGRLWDLDSGQLVGQVIESPLESSKPISVPGQPVGLVTLTKEWIKIWRFDPATWRDLACRTAGRNMTAAEWQQFGPRDQPYRPTCEQWPMPE